MAAQGFLLIATFLLVLMVLARPLGSGLARLINDIPLPGTTGVERVLFRALGVSDREMNWKQYLCAILGLNMLGLAVLFFMLLGQHYLPLNPQQLPGLSWDLALNTAVSFVTNTNWQSYSGETTLSYFSQMAGLTVQNFLSAASGIAVIFALIRAFTRQSMSTLGNAWVDLLRITLWVLVPVALLIALFFIQQGALQNFLPYQAVNTVEGAQQLLPMGPVASQEAIKMLGTNGGGFFNANSSHPFENPTALTNFVQMLAIFLIPTALCFAFGGGGAELVFYSAADALLAAAMGFCLRQFAPEKPGAGMLLVGAAAAAALGSVQLWQLLPGVIVCAALELYLCSKGQAKAALAACAVLGAALCAADPALSFAASGLACATVAAAVLAPGRRMETVAAYAGGCVTGALCVQPPGSAFQYLLNVCIGITAVAAMPAAWLVPEPEEKPQAGQAQPQQYSAAATRLEQVSQSLASLAETVNDVYETLPHRREDFHWVIDNTHDTLCFNCGRRDTCWKQEYAATLEGMEALRPLLESSGGLETAQLPGQLSRCIHPAALCAAANRSFALYRSRKEARLHAEAMRTALTEQYSAVAEALGVLGEQLGRPGDPEPYKSGRVADFFAQLGTPPQECAVTLDDLGRTHAAVTLPRTRFSAQELAALAGEVGRICRRTLEVPQVLSCKGMTTLLFSEKPVLRAVFGMAGAAARGSISGDAVQQFCSPAAAQMILCDGMGTGRPAAVDGNLAAELTARLLKAGFTAELAARLVNVALALKSEDESGATLDLISVDLYTGTARLFKAGAAPGFLVHGGRVRAVGDTSLPVGILGGVNGQSRVVHLTVGDYAVLVSDGLLVDGPGWVAKQLELSAAAGEAPEKIAKTLVETARVRAQKTGRPDDITAAVLRLEKCV